MNMNINLYNTNIDNNVHKYRILTIKDEN